MKNKIFELGNAGDILKFVELFYMNEIILNGTNFIISNKAISIFCGGKKTQKYKEKKELLDLLIANYTDYIINDKHAELYTAFNLIFFNFFNKVMLDIELMNVKLKEGQDKLTNYLIITNSVLEKYISYKLPTYKSINEFNNILNWNELMTISDCVLDIVDKLKENKIQNKEINLILHNIFKLVLKKNNIDIQDGSIVKNNKGKLYIPIDTFVFETDFYIDFLEGIDLIMDIKKEENINFLNRIDDILIELLENENKSFDNVKTGDMETDSLLIGISDISDIKNIVENIKRVYGIEIKTTVKVKTDQKEEENKNILSEIMIKKYQEKNKLIQNLKGKIKGQDTIIDSIVNNHIKKLLLGLNKRPLSFIFIGDSGVGKTELAKQIAISLDSKHLHLPMGNYQLEHTETSLLGSPPSYLGSDEVTILEKYLIEKKESNTIPVILFDEIEKGHNNIQNLFLEMFDEGTITFRNGNKYDLSKSIIILTSNLGLDKINKTSIGFGVDIDEEHNINKNNDIFHNAIKDYLRPEIINRISETYIFNKLNKNDKDSIINNLVIEKIAKLKENMILNKIFGNKIDKINNKSIIKLLKNIIDLNDFENIRKIESEIEKIIVDFLEK